MTRRDSPADFGGQRGGRGALRRLDSLLQLLHAVVRRGVVAGGGGGAGGGERTPEDGEMLEGGQRRIDRPDDAVGAERQPDADALTRHRQQAETGAPTSQRTDVSLTAG